MPAPSSPYATSTAVAYLLTTSLKAGTEFSALSTPTKAAVDEIITWVSAQLDLQFAMAGYVLPLTEIEGETWPAAQTVWLQMITALGAAALAGGHALKPAPALAPAQGNKTGNILQDLYNSELAKIYDIQTGKTFLRFRARYYASTPAENALVIPKGPTTDFMEGKYDPMRFLPLHEMADRVLLIQAELVSRGIAWDYLYGLFDIEKGLGSVIPSY